MLCFSELNFEELKEYERIGVAYSGGLDSHVLLHLLASKLDIESIYALHVNHGMSKYSDAWELHCKEVANDLGIEFSSWKINEDNNNLSLSEARLRDSRYAALTSWANDRDIICLGHHQNDQVETIFFRLIRGTGINGAKGISKKTRMDNVDIYRPLLDFSKEEIRAYAINEKLSWIEDETNLDDKYDRNFLRNQIIPLLSSRWPFLMKSLTNFSERASTAQLLLNELADEDIEKSINGGLSSVSLYYIQNISEARIKNFLHRWIWRLSNKSLETSMIDQVYHSIFKSKSSASPKVFIGPVDHTDSFEIRRYDDKLYAIPYESKSSLQDIFPVAWDLISPLTLSTGKLSSTKVKGRGLRYDKSLEAEVRGRNGGEIIRPPGRNCSKSLKKLFQEEYIPPWLRERVPLIYLNNELAAVANLWIDEKFLALENEQGIELSWQDNTFS